MSDQTQGGKNAASLAAHQAEVNSATAGLQAEDVITRIWRKDATVWSGSAEHAKIIGNSLGWLTVPEKTLARVGELEQFAEEIRQAGFTHAVVLGMGGRDVYKRQPEGYYRGADRGRRKELCRKLQHVAGRNRAPQERGAACLIKPRAARTPRPWQHIRLR